MKYLSLAVAAATFSAASAFAADLPSRKAPPAYIPPPPVFTWTGFYAGLNFGGGFLDNYNQNGLQQGWNGFAWAPVNIFNATNSNSGGVIGGGQAGYNYQISPMIVLGLETDIQGTSIGNDNLGWFSQPTRGVPWFGTVRARAGLSLFSPQLLFYGTGGFAYGDIRLNIDPVNTLRQTGTGWTAGGGVEWAFMPNLSAKAEYLYASIGANFPPNPVEQRVRMHTIRAGVNYHFNFGPSVPVMAAY